MARLESNPWSGWGEGACTRACARAPHTRTGPNATPLPPLPPGRSNTMAMRGLMADIPTLESTAPSSYLKGTEVRARAGALATHDGRGRSGFGVGGG